MTLSRRTWILFAILAVLVVLDLAGGEAKALLSSRAAKALDEYDGLRIDHPHGLVCPWVYRADDPDPYRAVRAGASRSG